MNREQAIKTLQEIGSKLAKEYGFELVVIGEDRQKGIWGENLTKFLEEKYGECSKEIKWMKEEGNFEEYIEFRFRFSNPCLSIRMPGEVHCGIELSDYCYETKESTGEFDISQILVWKKKGLKLQDKLLNEWNSYLYKSKKKKTPYIVVGNKVFETKNAACWHHGLSYSNVYNNAKKSGLSFEESILDLASKQYVVQGLGFNSKEDLGSFFGLSKTMINMLMDNDQGLSLEEVMSAKFGDADYYILKVNREKERRNSYIVEVLE